jgi:hypothetical protein
MHAFKLARIIIKEFGIIWSCPFSYHNSNACLRLRTTKIQFQSAKYISLTKFGHRKSHTLSKQSSPATRHVELGGGEEV